MKSKCNVLLLIGGLACGATFGQIPAPLMKGLESLIKKNEPDQRGAPPNAPGATAAPASNNAAPPKATEASSTNVAVAKQETAATTSRYVISQDKTETTDSQTGLTWTRNRQRIFMGLLYDGQKNMATQAPYSKALEHAKLVSQKDAMAWRLPTVEEISTLRIRTAEEAATKSASSFDRTLFDVNAFPGILEAGGMRFWTADTVPPNRNPVNKAQAVTFSLDAGDAVPYAKAMDANDLLRVILVRGTMKK